MTGPTTLPPAPLDDAAFAATEPVPRSNWQLFRRRFFRHKLTWVSLAILTILIVGCFGAKWLAPHEGRYDSCAALRAQASRPRVASG